MLERFLNIYPKIYLKIEHNLFFKNLSLKIYVDPLGRGNKQDLLTKLGAQGLGENGGQEGKRRWRKKWRRRTERNRIVKMEKDTDGEQRQIF